MIPDKKMIPDMNRLAKHNQYLFMQKGARARTAELTVEMLKHKKQVRLLEPRHWPPNCPDLNSVHFRIWRTGIYILQSPGFDSGSKIYTVAEG